MARIWLGKTQVIHTLALWLAILVAGTIMVLSWIGPGPLIRLENDLLDFRFKLRGERQPGDDIIVVTVDEKSLKEVGRWPWSRDKQAQLVRTIAADKAKVIGLDIIYSEAEVTEYLRGLQELIAAANTAAGPPASFTGLLRQKLAEADTDRQFAASLREAGNVVLALPLLVPESGAGSRSRTKETLPPEYLKKHLFMLVRQAKGGKALEPQRAADADPPLKPFADQALSLGHVYSLPDVDGITRYEYLAISYGTEDDYYPSLGLEIARLYLDVPRDRMSLTLGEGVRVGDRLIPTDQKSRMLIDHVGREASFRYVSATDVIHQRFPPGTFSGKAVLVGTSALGTYDQKSTPFSANFPGVEKNAAVVENIIHGRFLEKGIWAGPLDLGLIAAFGLTLGFVLPRLKALPGVLVAFAALAGYALTAQYLFIEHGVWLDVVYPMLTIAITFTAITVLRFMTEEKQAKEVRAMFSSYVSPRIVEELIKDPAKARLGGQRKELTMLFSDVAGFTAFSEKHSAEEVVAQLNEYLGAMTDVIFRWNGTLDKFVGDAIVVFWGAPLEQPNHVELSIKCALHMRKRLEELQEKWKAEGKVPFENGIGINTGHAVVGNIGAEGKKMDYTMIGDHVNLAARAEGLTRKFGCPIVITEYTAERLKQLMGAEENQDNRGRISHIDLRKLGAVKVKGKDQPVVVYGLGSLGRDQASVVAEDASEETLEMTEK
ncbi:MAG: adenylate/guanylate cyclase domain-containing protein [Nitrospirae bacterium]|nr:MAG: adenylate/guanylate cyclase domain-containing protein [Nitrospirota bacterium]